MSSKASRPCLACGKRLAIHRGKQLCSKLCRDQVKRLQTEELKARRYRRRS